MRILLADDDALYRTLLSATLRRWGFEIEMVENGEQALARLTAPDAPPLAILDWMMPGLSGPEVCRRVRAHSAVRYTYILLLTARDRTEDLVAGLEAGADDYLTKPFDVSELRARLRAAQRILDLQDQLLSSRQELEALATHDPVTQLWNRRAILDRLAKEAARAGREGKIIAAILLDVDHFHRVNDAHGHRVGDQLLGELARRLGAALRPYDLLGRFGGDEFLVTLTTETTDAAERVAERLRIAVAAGPLCLQGAEIGVTVSAGVAVVPAAAAHDPQLLVHAAEQMLALAKREGRNCVRANLSAVPSPC